MLTYILLSFLEPRVLQHFWEKNSTINSTTWITFFDKDPDKSLFFVIYPEKVQPILAAFSQKIPRSIISKNLAFLFFREYRLFGIFHEAKFWNLRYSFKIMIWNIGKFLRYFFLLILAGLKDDFFSRVYKRKLLYHYLISYMFFNWIPFFGK